MAKKKLCQSCSGPLDEYSDDQLVNPDFCPYCVDRKGRLKSYKEILDGMIEYIESDHPEIKPQKRKKQAEEWLVEGPVWGAVWSGAIVEESLEAKDILKKLKVVDIKEELDDNPKTNGGYPLWHIYHVEIKRKDLDGIAGELQKSLKGGGWWCDLSWKDEMCIVFRGKVFLGKKSDRAFRKEVNKYAEKHGVPASQLPLKGRK